MTSLNKYIDNHNQEIEETQEQILEIQKQLRDLEQQFMTTINLSSIIKKNNNNTPWFIWYGWRVEILYNVDKCWS